MALPDSWPRRKELHGQRLYAPSVTRLPDHPALDRTWFGRYGCCLRRERTRVRVGLHRTRSSTPVRYASAAPVGEGTIRGFAGLRGRQPESLRRSPVDPGSENMTSGQLRMLRNFQLLSQRAEAVGILDQSRSDRFDGVERTACTGWKHQDPDRA